MHPISPPSPFVLRWSHLPTPGSRVLDFASGSGRHGRLFASLGHQVTAIDRDASALATMTGLERITTVCADLESGAWPLHGQRFAVVVVTNYLWRPRLPELLASVAGGGLLIYETFAVGNERFGRPHRPEFLLEPDELFTRLAPLGRVLAFEQGARKDLDPGSTPDAVIQRIVCRFAA